MDKITYNKQWINFINGTENNADTIQNSVIDKKISEIPLILSKIFHKIVTMGSRITLLFIKRIILLNNNYYKWNSVFIKKHWVSGKIKFKRSAFRWH